MRGPRTESWGFQHVEPGREERPRRWKENRELWRPGARRRLARRERSPGAGVRPGKRRATTALGSAA